MSILAKPWRPIIVLARTYDAAFWTLEWPSNRQLEKYGITRADIWRVATGSRPRRPTRRQPHRPPLARGDDQMRPEHPGVIAA